MKRNYISLLTVLMVSSAAHSEIVSTVGVDAVYDDNIYRLQSDEADAWITKVRPGVAIDMGQGSATYKVQATAESGVYSQSKLGDDDYTDYHLKGLAEWELDMRNRLQMELHQLKAHDDRGTGRMDVVGKLAAIPGGDFEEPDEWIRNGIGAGYGFGAQDAKGAIMVSGAYNEKDYINNGPSTDRLDRDDTEMRLLALLKVMPRTSLLLETRWKDIDYVEDAINRDSEDMRYFVGAQWEATAKTTGAVRFGYQEKDPADTTTFDSFSSTAWELDVAWAPRTYSTVEFTAFRGIEDSSDALDYIDYELYSVRWKHKWSDRLSSALFGQLETEDYDQSTREDDTDSWGFSATYQIIKQVKLNGEYRYEDRSSSLDGLDYERNIVLVGAEVSFE